LFQHNAFTEAFQIVVDTYGVPNYKEANPALLTIITFPFFFGVMYGDILHGLIILIFGMWLCLAKRENGNLAEMLAPGRYFILLMGFFSLYCGFIYNDLTSMATEAFGKSCYNVGNQMSDEWKSAHTWVEAAYDQTGDLPYSQPPCTFSDSLCVIKDCVYKFGVDPIWYSSKEEITYLNSLKMKGSVIFGVWQMSMGTFIKGMNAVYNGHWIELIFVVFTQMTLLMALFGLMDTMIVIKWLTDWDAKGE
jgi:V-type H+-transporting ATPase subunit a